MAGAAIGAPNRSGGKNAYSSPWCVLDCTVTAVQNIEMEKPKGGLLASPMKNTVDY